MNIDIEDVLHLSKGTVNQACKPVKQTPSLALMPFFISEMRYHTFGISDFEMENREQYGWQS